jgi:hypothetical protein
MFRRDPNCRKPSILQLGQKRRADTGILDQDLMSGSSARTGNTTESMRKPFESRAMDISPIKSQRDYRSATFAPGRSA